MIRTCLALKPLYEEILNTILQTGNVFIDESPVDMLAPGKGKTEQAYMWAIVSNGLCGFHFREDRKHIKTIGISRADAL